MSLAFFTEKTGYQVCLAAIWEADGSSPGAEEYWLTLSVVVGKCAHADIYESMCWKRQSNPSNMLLFHICMEDRQDMAFICYCVMRSCQELVKEYVIQILKELN